MRLHKILHFLLVALLCCAPIGIHAQKSGHKSPSTEGKPAGSAQKQQKPKKREVTVYFTKTGEKYHRDGCRYLRRSQIAISLADARNAYSACSVCEPPE